MKSALPSLVALIFMGAVMSNACGQQFDLSSEMKAIEYLSAADHTRQPAYFYAPETNAPAPLLVMLHAWSEDWKSIEASGYRTLFAQWLQDHPWVFIYPNFRGSNANRDSLGSDLAVADIVSAVEYARKHAHVDEKRIYLLGGSGGGHMALVMAGRHPEIWAGVSAWTPPTDLVAFYHECRLSAPGAPFKWELMKNLENACGGQPGADAAVDEQYRRRSPLMWLPNAKNLPLDINAGIADGFGSDTVSVYHPIKAFNAVAEPKDRVTENEMNGFTPTDVPKGQEFKGSDLTYGDKPPLFRRQSGRTRITVFKGGHNLIWNAALTWLAQQQQP